MEENNEAGPVVDNTVEKIKVKKPKMKKFDNSDNGVFKVDLAKSDETVEQDVIKVDLTKPVDEVKQEQIVDQPVFLEEISRG
jgi:S1-C subfamily serine protease